jgi:serine/threonine protein kinase/tetratricopeptide (TPR) repeat protein
MKDIIAGRFEFDRETDLVGEGGMGQVFRAHDRETGVTVAVKQLSKKVATPDNVERFMREAEALRRLDHPNIVKVLQTVEEDGSSYIIMEYISGGSLEDLLRAESSLPIDRVLQIALDVSDALTRAHRVGIIHRDIKPANVLLDADGTPHLTDFGVAHLNDKSRVTQTGSVVGTLNYLSPEALNGSTVDERSDIWAFGVLLYEMLAGRRPFDSDTASGLITAILTAPTPDVDDFRPDLPAKLTLLIHEMLIKEREERIDSVRKVGSEIEDIIRGVDSGELTMDYNPADAPRPASRFATSSESQGQVKTPGGNLQRIITDSGEEYYMIPTQSAGRVRILLGSAFVILLLAVFGGVLLLTQINDRSDADEETALDPPPVDQPLAERVPPVADGEYMVLVIPFNGPGGREASAAIARDLRRYFESEIPFSNIRIREITIPLRESALSAGEIDQLAEEVGAAVVVGGAITQNGLRVSVRVGSLRPFPYNEFSQPVLARTADVILQLDDPLQQTVAPYVASVLGVLHSADGDLFELMRVMTILQDLPDPDLTVLDETLGALTARFYASYLSDPATAIIAMDDALERDGGNPLFYSYRAFAQTRAGNAENIFDDLTTAARIGPESWIFPSFLQTITPFALMDIDPEDVEVTELRDALQTRPDDWFLRHFVADAAYTSGRLTVANRINQTALDNDPQMNMVHILGVQIAFRQGEVTRAGRLLDELVREFPDPNFSSRVLNATVGDAIGNSALAYDIFANLFIGQYNTVIDKTDAFFIYVEQLLASLEDDMLRMQFGAYLGDLYMARGIAECASGDYEAALDSYNTALEVSPDYHLVYLLRSEIHLLMGDDVASLADLERATGLSDELDALIDLLMSEQAAGETGCETFFETTVQFAEAQAG